MSAAASRRATAELSRADARHLLGAYHFTSRGIADTFEHLGTVQYDPLNPLGRNPDLVLQARVAGYRVDGWQRHVYRRRLAYDAWDKQVCLTPVEDWPYRRIYHRHFRRTWGDHALDRYPDEARRVVAELERRGPLSSLDFDDEMFDDHRPERMQGSWYGDKLVKHLLRGLWLSGEIVTHHRDKGRHVYDLPQRVLPAEVLERPDPGEDASLRHLLRQRVRSAGLLRPGAGRDLWSVPVDAGRRRRVLDDLLAEGELVRVDVEGDAFLAVPEALSYAERPTPRGMRFLAPLDGVMWDRKGVQALFDFDYAWEVYKPEHLRRWGYYVLPVWHSNRMVARFDSRREDDGEGGTWRVFRFDWEGGASAAQLRALGAAAGRFARYLGVARLATGAGVDAATGAALAAGVEAVQA